MTSGLKETRFRYWLNQKKFFQTFDIEWMFIKDIHFKYLEDIIDSNK